MWAEESSFGILLGEKLVPEGYGGYNEIQSSDSAYLRGFRTYRLGGEVVVNTVNWLSCTVFDTGLIADSLIGHLILVRHIVGMYSRRHTRSVVLSSD